MIHPFLASTHRVNTNILVVEGWVHEYVIRGAATEYKDGAYQRVFSTGGPSTGGGGYTSDADTSASVGAGQLRAAGIPSALVEMVPSRVIGQDRTYYSAIALRDWFREHHMSVANFNVVAESTHARRTWLLFQEAFGKHVKRDTFDIDQVPGGVGQVGQQIHADVGDRNQQNASLHQRIVAEVDRLLKQHEAALLQSAFQR
jgi:hypothetical protein